MRLRQLTPAILCFQPVTGSAAAVRHRPSRSFVLLPYAGGGAHSLAQWLPYLLQSGDTAFAVQYPGRGLRAHEPVAGNLADIADEAAEGLQKHADGPFVVIGHSMGAVLGYETVIRLELASRVSLLVASASRPPHLLDTDPCNLAQLTTADWVARMLSDGFAGVDEMPEEILLDTVAALRSDCLLTARHAVHGGLLKCRILAIGGESDTGVSAEDLRAWAALTSGVVTTRLLAGGHFYYYDRLPEVGELIVQEIAQAERDAPQFAQQEIKRQPSV